jgi:hypothetical protein
LTRKGVVKLDLLRRFQSKHDKKKAISVRCVDTTPSTAFQAGTETNIQDTEPSEIEFRGVIGRCLGHQQSPHASTNLPRADIPETPPPIAAALTIQEIDHFEAFFERGRPPSPLVVMTEVKPAQPNTEVKPEKEIAIDAPPRRLTMQAELSEIVEEILRLEHQHRIRGLRYDRVRYLGDFSLWKRKEFLLDYLYSLCDTLEVTAGMGTLNQQP